MMSAANPEEVYREVASEDLILRDVLALERTALANERTLLAYVRTGLALLGGSIGLIHFVGIGWVEVIGWITLPSAPVVFAVGARRFFQVRRRLREVT